MSSKDGISGAKRLVPALAITLSLIIPQGLVLADSSALSTEQLLRQAAGDTMQQVTQSLRTPDPSLAKITQEEAVEKVQYIFPILKNAQVSNIELGVSNSYPAPRNQMVWTMNWSYSLGNTTYGFSSSVDAITGDLIQGFIHSIYQGDESYPPKLSREEALVKAKQYITKAVSSIDLDDLHLNNTGSNYGEALFGPIKYSYTFNVHKNGVASEIEYIRVSVSSNGDLLEFSRPSDHYSYPSSKPKITLEEAKQKQEKDFSVQLAYVPVYKNNRVNDWMLAWSPNRDTVLNAIDANTGMRLDDAGNVAGDEGVIYESIPKASVVFQPRESSKELTTDEAAGIVKNLLRIPSDRTLVTQSTRSDYWDKDRVLTNITWQSQDQYRSGTFPSRTSAELDARTGEIVTYYYEDFPAVDSLNASHDDKSSESTKLSSDALKTKAMEWINLLYHDASTKLKLVNRGTTNQGTDKDTKEHTYSFERFHEGIAVQGNAATLVLDDYGRVVSYNSSHYKLSESLPNPSQVKMTKEKAQEIYASEMDQELQYRNYGSKMSNGTYTEPDVRLVYTSEYKNNQRNNQVLDAITGKWSKYHNDITFSEEDSSEQVTDIKGHWAEKSLATLLAYNLLEVDAEGKVKPNEVLTQGQWLSLITKAITPYYQGYSSAMNNQQQEIAGVSPDHEYYELASYALRRQWIKADDILSLDEELTREKLAVWVSSILNYNKISKFMDKDPIFTNLKDASRINHRGAVALVLKLGLFQPQNGSFNGSGKVTRAEAATVLMRMVELQGKIDTKFTE